MPDRTRTSKLFMLWLLLLLMMTKMMIKMMMMIMMIYFTDETASSVERLREVRGSLLTPEVCSEKWGTNFTQDVVCFSSNGRGPCAVSVSLHMVCNSHRKGRL